MKRYLPRLGFVILLILAAFILFPMQDGLADNDIRVTYDGDAVRFANAPISLNGVTYVETRPLMQAIGLSISWLDARKVRFYKIGLTVDMAIGSKTAYVNGNARTLAATPVLQGSKLFLPVRPFASLLQFNLLWDADARLIALVSATGGGQAPSPKSTEPAAPSKPAESSKPTSSYKIIGYYPAWALYQEYDVAKLATSGITHINYAFANIADGRIALGDPDADKTNFAALRKLKQANPKLKTLISVGGWTWSGRFSDAAASIYSRNLFADSAVQFIRQNGFDGVDLDWEYPVSGGLPGNKTRPEDKKNFTLLLQAIRDKLDAAGAKDGKTYLLTIAAGASQANANQLEVGNIAGIVDWISLMTYDYHGDWESRSNHNAPLYADPADPVSAKNNADYTVKAYIKAGAPASKLVLGIPFYGRSWTGCGTDNLAMYQDCAGVAKGVLADGVHEYGNLVGKGWTAGNGFVRYWNDSSKTPWLYSAANGGTFISYEDPESIGYKAGYIKSKGLAGAMIWEMSQDYGHTLSDKLTKALK